MYFKLYRPLYRNPAKIRVSIDSIKLTARIAATGLKSMPLKGLIKRRMGFRIGSTIRAIPMRRGFSADMNIDKITCKNNKNTIDRAKIWINRIINCIVPQSVYVRGPSNRSPMRTTVDPSSIATSKSADVPAEIWSSVASFTWLFR